MKLLYDLRSTQPSSGKRHGGGRYGEVIFFRMVKLGIAFSCFYDSRRWFNPDVKAVIDEKQISLFDIAERSVQNIVDEYNFDRVYSCIAHPDTTYNLNGCQKFVTIHDLGSEDCLIDRCFLDYKMPLKEKAKILIKIMLPGLDRKRLAKKTSRIYKDVIFVVVSNYTKDALLCRHPEFKNRNIPVFFSPNTSLNEGDNPKVIIRKDNSEKYFLGVSGNRWTKNNGRAIQAFDRLVDSGLIEGVRMKVTGATKENFKFKIKHPEIFDFLGYVSDEELEQLYANAYLFVYPTFHEGFGYPPIEAMRYHVPVIASPFTSVAEICDSGALYFNPFSVEEIMNRMLMMMDPERHAEFAERGYQQYLKISERQRRDLDGVIDFITS